MQATETRNSIGLGTGLATCLAAVMFILLTATFGTSVAAVEEQTSAIQAVEQFVNQPDMLADITFGGAVTDEDIAYLRASLEMLHDVLPAWWQYVMDAKPLTLSVDLAQGARGRAAIAQCCDAQGYGSITFGHHFGTRE